MCFRFYAMAWRCVHLLDIYFVCWNSMADFTMCVSVRFVFFFSILLYRLLIFMQLVFLYLFSWTFTLVCLLFLVMITNIRFCICHCVYVLLMLSLIFSYLFFSSVSSVVFQFFFLERFWFFNFFLYLALFYVWFIKHKFMKYSNSFRKLQADDVSITVKVGAVI